MQHTLEPEQYVLVDKLTPRFDTYKRGDIVVFTPPADWVQDDGTPFIKRVIGLGGDTVDIHDGNVYINGTKIDEPATCTRSPPSSTPQPTTVQGDQHRWVVAAGRRVPDGRPSGRIRRTRGPSGPWRCRRSSGAPGCATGRSTCSGSSRRRPTRSWPRPAHEPAAVNPALVGVALAVVVGAVVAGSARNARTAIFGLVIVMVGVPLLADPVRRSARPRRPSRGRRPGRLPAVGRRPRPPGPDRRLARRLADRHVPGDRGAAVVGYGSQGLGAPAAGPALAAAAGFALAALAVLPVVTGRDILRVGLGPQPPAERRAPRPDEPRRHARPARTADHGRPRGDARRGGRDPGRRRPVGRRVRLRDERDRRRSGPSSRRPTPTRPSRDEPARLRRRRVRLRRPRARRRGRRPRAATRSALVGLRCDARRGHPRSTRARSWSIGGRRPRDDGLPAAVPGPRLAGRPRPGRVRPRRRLAPGRAGGHPRRSSRRRPDPRPGRPPCRRPRRDRGRPVRGARHAHARRTAAPARRSASARRGRSIVAGRPGHRRDGLVRARPEPAGGPAGRLRARLPRLRGRGRDALRGDPVPPLGGAPDRCRPRGRPADPDRDGPGLAGDRRPGLDGRIGRAAARRPRRGRG